jgi:hypothetical protein
VIALEESGQDDCAPRWTLAQALPEIEGELPESVRGMIERKIAQLEPAKRYSLSQRKKAWRSGWVWERSCMAGQLPSWERRKRECPIKEGLAALDEAEARAEKNEDHFWDAELRRLRGGLLLLDGAAAEEAELCFHQAIEIARRRQAKSLELRAVMSLAQLWQRQGKAAEARRTLAGIHGWFTEGFDTADLKYE